VVATGVVVVVGSMHLPSAPVPKPHMWVVLAAVVVVVAADVVVTGLDDVVEVEVLVGWMHLPSAPVP